jgi:hypothetical protein
MKATILRLLGAFGLLVAFVHFFILRLVVSYEINVGMRTWTRNLFDPEKKKPEVTYSDLYNHLNRLLDMRDASDRRMMIIIFLLIIGISVILLLWARDIRKNQK